MGASFAAMMFPCPVIAPEAAAHQGIFAPHGSVWSAAAWLFLLPGASRAYRAAIRSRPRASRADSRPVRRRRRRPLWTTRVPTPPSRKTSSVISAGDCRRVRAHAWGISRPTLLSSRFRCWRCTAPVCGGESIGDDARSDCAAQGTRRWWTAVRGACRDAPLAGQRDGLRVDASRDQLDVAHSRWIIASACATVNLTVYALFSAEAA